MKVEVTIDAMEMESDEVLDQRTEAILKAAKRAIDFLRAAES